jgi:hypothetical protein
MGSIDSVKYNLHTIQEEKRSIEASKRRVVSPRPIIEMGFEGNGAQGLGELRNEEFAQKNESHCVVVTPTGNEPENDTETPKKTTKILKTRANTNKMVVSIKKGSQSPEKTSEKRSKTLVDSPSRRNSPIEK